MDQANLHVIDSHTEGEPTRIVGSGAPDLGNGPLADRARILREEHDWLRSAVCKEPRGHEAMVGALLCEPNEPDCCCGVIFFNNVSTLYMCIHGTIGLVVTLAHMGKIRAGIHRIDTSIGVISAELRDDGSVEVANVPSYRKAAAIPVEVPGWGVVRGDIAWGGNWFFSSKNTARRWISKKLKRSSPSLGPYARSLRNKVSPAMTGWKSTTSKSSARQRILPSQTAATSCSAPEKPTTARPVVPAPARNLPASTPPENSTHL